MDDPRKLTMLSLMFVFNDAVVCGGGEKVKVYGDGDVELLLWMILGS